MMALCMGVAAAGTPAMESNALARFDGLIDGKTPGWTLLQAEAGKMVHVPFEGSYESKGGRIQSPIIPLDKAVARPAYYRLTFRARTSDHCYWWVDLFDAERQPLPDINSAVYPHAQQKDYDQMLYVQADAAALQLAFQSAQGVAVRDLTVSQASMAEAARWGDELYAQLPPLSFEPPADAFALLPKTAAALHDGRPWRVVMLGDSIQNDSYNSVFQALVQRDFPNANLAFVISARGSTGCAYYREREHFADYVARHKPDLLMIGGISNRLAGSPDAAENARAVGAVIEQARALGCEIVLLSPPLSVDWRPVEPGTAEMPRWRENTLTAGNLAWSPYAAVAREHGIAFWNLTVPTADYLAASGKEHGYFNRDRVHNNDRGKQIIGRVLHRFFLTARA